MDLSIGELIVPAFIAGLLTFLAPCSFPLIPGYIGFISGVSFEDLTSEKKRSHIRKRVFLNGLLYVAGFSIVFIFLGTIFGLVGSAFAEYQLWLTRIGGLLVMFFGLYLMGLFRLKVFKGLLKERRISITQKLKPGKPGSSFLFGAAFAFGWTPCVGPVLGAILVLASTSGTVLQGAILLLVFSAGLAIPFLIVALGIGHAAQYIQKISKYLNVVSFIGGAFLIVMGAFLFLNQFSRFIGYFYSWFEFINYEAILNYL